MLSSLGGIAEIERATFGDGGPAAAATAARRPTTVPNTAPPKPAT
jgi:hypothetical protein